MIFEKYKIFYTMQLVQPINHLIKIAIEKKIYIKIKFIISIIYKNYILNKKLNSFSNLSHKINIKFF